MKVLDNIYEQVESDHAQSEIYIKVGMLLNKGDFMTTQRMLKSSVAQWVAQKQELRQLSTLGIILKQPPRGRLLRILTELAIDLYILT